jgi:hypothetical protein
VANDSNSTIMMLDAVRNLSDWRIKHPEFFDAETSNAEALMPAD